MTQDNSVTHPRQFGHTFRQLGTLSYCGRIVLNVIIVGRQLGPLSKKVTELSRQKKIPSCLSAIHVGSELSIYQLLAHKVCPTSQDQNKTKYVKNQPSIYRDIPNLQSEKYKITLYIYNSPVPKRTLRSKARVLETYPPLEIKVELASGIS